MRLRRTCAVLLVSTSVALWTLPAQAAAKFGPKTSFTLSSKKVKANPMVTVNVAQGAGEENISKVTIVIPAGFTLPTDSKVKNGEGLGSGKISIASQPACSTASEQNFNATLTEKDRTSAQKQKGVQAVWVLDLSFTTISLEVFGSTSKGWKVTAGVPSTPATCPPFSFKLTVNKTTSSSKTKIFQNPSSAGSYTFKAMWVSDKGTKYSSSQAVKITA